MKLRRSRSQENLNFIDAASAAPDKDGDQYEPQNFHGKESLERNNFCGLMASTTTNQQKQAEIVENQRLSGSFIPQAPAAISSLPGVRSGASNLARGRERAVS